jgi:Fe-S cluster assembly protein SufD
MVQEQTLKEKLLAEFEKQNPAGRDESIGLAGFRNSALETFRKKGFPGKKQEDYRYLNFDPLFASLPELQPMALAGRLPEQPAWDKDCYRVAIVNGNFLPDWSELNGLPEGVGICSLQEALAGKDVMALASIGTLARNDEDPFMALNSALFSNGVFINIPEGKVLEKPLHLCIMNSGTVNLFTQPRILILAGNNASADIIQSFTSHDLPASFTNSLCEIQTGENVRLNLCCIQAEGWEQSQVNSTEIHIRKNTVLHTVTVTIGGRLVRNNLNVVLDSPDCEAHLYGYYHPLGDQTFDNHTLVDHRFPHCNSNELYKGVAGAGGHAVFNGKVFVRKDAQKTNAFQSNRNILLSDDATVNTKPQLEIYADDVKCSHGSSTGYLDPEQLFYLRSRGISLEKARALLLKAYAGEILDQISHDKLRQWLSDKIETLH